MKSHRLRLLIVTVATGLLALALAACGSSPTATPTQPAATNTPTPTQAMSETPTPSGQTPSPAVTPSAPGGTTPTPTGASDFNAQWQALIKQAQQEGEVDIVAGGVASRTYQPVMDYFTQQFGVKVNFSTGSSSEQSSRVLAERQSGKYTVDIAMTGANTSANAYIPAGAMDPVAQYLFRPDVVDKSLWFQGKWWWGDEQQKYNFIYSANVQEPPTNIEINTNEVNPSDITSVKDFLADKYKGHLAALPPTFGGSQEQYFEAYEHPDLGPDFVKTYLQDMNVFFSSDYRQIENQLADGTIYATIFAGAVRQDIDTMKSQGLPVDHLIKQVKERGQLVSAGSGSNIGIFNHPAHPAAAKLFLNWWLSKDGQTAMEQKSAAPPYVSLREDNIPPGKTLPSTRRQPGQQYLYLSADPSVLAHRDEVKQQTIDWYNQANGQ